MPHATLADAPTFERHGFTFRPLAVPSRGSAELAVWALEVAPGAISEPHTLSREEVFVLGSGTVSASVAGQISTLAPGDALIVPVGAELELRNDSATAARLTACTSAGMLGTVDGQTFSPPWAQ